MYKKFPPGYITKSSVLTVLGGGAVFFGYQIAAGKEKLQKDVLLPLVHRICSGERAHKCAVKLAKLGGTVPLWGSIYQEYPELETKVWDLDFKNPIGLAAGFDKDGEAITGLKQLGFGFVEIGSVTPLPQPGNPKPRVFRLREDSGVINRYGFNSAGHGPVMARVKDAMDVSDSSKTGVFLGVNLGKNKNSEDPKMDYSVGVINFGPLCDYLAINVSSPNTPGLRALQGRKELEELLRVVHDSHKRILGGKHPKVLLKVSPDLSLQEKQDIAAICQNSRFGVDGLIVGNTTTSRPQSLRRDAESGGLSGEPLKDLSTECIRDFYRLTNGKVAIIGCGGVGNGRDAYDKMRAGASLIQVYTALVFQGFPVLGRIKRELVECLNKDGFTKVEEVVGIDSMPKKN